MEFCQFDGRHVNSCMLSMVSMLNLGCPVLGSSMLSRPKKIFFVPFRIFSRTNEQKALQSVVSSYVIRNVHYFHHAHMGGIMSRGAARHKIRHFLPAKDIPVHNNTDICQKMQSGPQKQRCQGEHPAPWIEKENKKGCMKKRGNHSAKFSPYRSPEESTTIWDSSVIYFCLLSGTGMLCNLENIPECLPDSVIHNGDMLQKGKFC